MQKKTLFNYQKKNVMPFEEKKLTIVMLAEENKKDHFTYILSRFSNTYILLDFSLKIKKVQECDYKTESPSIIYVYEITVSIYKSHRNHTYSV